MGVAPDPAKGRANSAPPAEYAGNLDNKDLVAGTKLFIPVFVPGALFEVGDGHAGQGNGEADITAMETSLIGTFQFIVRSGYMRLTRICREGYTMNYMQFQVPQSMFSEFSKRWMAVATEMSEYVKRCFDDGSATLAKVMTAKSIEEAIDIQTEFAKRAYDAHLKQMVWIGGMCAELAKVPSHFSQ